MERRTNQLLRWPLTCALWFGAVLLGECSPPSNECDNPLSRFKNLLEDPPIIERLVFSERLPQVVTKAVPLESGIADSTNQMVCELRWQPNAMLFRQIAGLGDLTNNAVGGAAFAVFNDHFYFLGGGHPMLYVLDDANTKTENLPSAYHASLIHRTRACEPLNLGISHLLPGLLRWHSNEFAAVTTADKKSMYIRGAITGFTNDIPCEVTVQYSNNMGTANYRIGYSYDHYAAPYYPSKIDIFFRHRGKEILYRAYTLLSVVTSNKRLPETHFDPAPYIRASGLPLIYLTNDSAYYKLPSGRLIESRSAIPQLKLSEADFRKNRPYYVAASVLSLSFLALMVRERIK